MQKSLAAQWDFNDHIIHAHLLKNRVLQAKHISIKVSSPVNVRKFSKICSPLQICWKLALFLVQYGSTICAHLWCVSQLKSSYIPF